MQTRRWPLRSSRKGLRMLKDGIYYPSNDDRAIFKRIITVVRQNPAWFVPSAAALDRDYSTQAIRDRLAAELRERHANSLLEAEALGAKPNHIRQSRAFQRKYCQYEGLSQQLGFAVTASEVVPAPPKRSRDADGNLQQPAFDLRTRFAIAFEDAFKVERDLDRHELHESLNIAARHVLLAWLRMDPNRGTVQRVTEFQKLRDKPTEDGNGPLWIPDDAVFQSDDKTRYVRQDGGMERDAPAWIKQACDAIDFLQSQADSTGLVFVAGNHAAYADANNTPQSNLSGRITASPEMLETAIADLLVRIPDIWEVYHPDKLSSTQEQALFLLVAAGLVEKRDRMRMRFADSPVIAEATITATGAYGGVEALQTLFANLWTDWKDAFQSWQQSEADGVLPAHCDRLEPSEWRLTDQGVISRNDLDAPPSNDIPADVYRQGVFDFVLKRGVFKDRDSVRGTGALVKMNKAKADSAPAAVNIGNWSEGGDAFAHAFGPMMAKMFEAMQQAQPKAERGNANWPYPYGSDLHWLWAWANRIDQWMVQGTLPNRHLQGIFRPDQLTDQAITKLSDKYPQAFGLIQTDLSDVQTAFDGQNGSDEMQEELLAGMVRLRDRIRIVAKMVADGDADETTGQSDDGKAKPLSGMSWQDALKRAEEHVKAHDGALPSVKRLAEIVGCSRPTMDKAISNSTYLKARKAEKSQPARTQPLNDISIEQASEQAWRDAELAKLVEEQKADQARDDRQEKAAKKRRT